jgi:ribosome biogenesis GTPase / thiamine phosphate phosphatase
MKGKIIKGIAGFYYVVCDEKIYSCKAKGIFRNRNIKPMIGDDVDFSITDDAALEGNIDEILPRRNSLVRPSVANVDLALMTMSCAHPAPQLYLLDKYLISMDMQELPVAVVFTKCELTDDGGASFKKIYDNAGFRTFCISADTGAGLPELLEYIDGKTSVLAGPSGVGKSTLTNGICPDAAMETNDISRKIERGRHTTRHCELFVVNDHTFICDTPGFTSVLVESLLPDQLKLYMPDLAKYEGCCRFDNCVHIKEPGCRVKEDVERGVIEKTRYESYKKIYSELSDIKRY